MATTSSLPAPFSWMTDILAEQHTFQSEPLIAWHREHAEVPVLALAVYLVMLFGGRSVMKNRSAFRLKPLFAAWNLLLAVYSMFGAYYTLPVLLGRVADKGFVASVCNSPDWYTEGASGFWLALFIYSKFAELLDTAFLVARKKKVIFLHWFHHVTVLLYCWHAYHHSIGAGIWFACMNYCVHSIMYMYYFMANVGMMKIIAPIAPLITTVQISQMVGGMAVLITVAYQRQTLADPNMCVADSANWKLGLSMYFSYFILFVILFVNKYSAKPSASSKSAASAAICSGNSSDDDIKSIDASGFFHSSKSVGGSKNSSKKAN